MMGKIDISTNEYMREPARVADLLNGFVYHGADRFVLRQGEVGWSEKSAGYDRSGGVPAGDP